MHIWNLFLSKWKQTIEGRGRRTTQGELDLTASLNLVLMIPGAMTFMRMFSSARLGASALTSPSSAVLLTEYAPNN